MPAAGVLLCIGCPLQTTGAPTHLKDCQMHPAVGRRDSSVLALMLKAGAESASLAWDTRGRRAPGSHRSHREPHCRMRC